MSLVGAKWMELITNKTQIRNNNIKYTGLPSCLWFNMYGVFFLLAIRIQVFGVAYERKMIQRDTDSRVAKFALTWEERKIFSGMNTYFTGENEAHD